MDVDTATGVPEKDVDDGVALIQAFRSPELEIRGVSVVYGNTDLERALPIARHAVTEYGPEGLRVHRGAASAAELGEETPATRALEAALERQPLTLLVLGPATNVATVLKRRPDLADRVVELIAVAGRRPGQRFVTGTVNARGHRDFNFEQDPDAFRVILDSGVPLTLAPWEISSKIWITDAELARWAEGDAATRWLARAAQSWIGLWKRSFEVDGFNPFDTLAVAVLTHPELITCEELPIAIAVGPNDVTAPEMQGSTKPEDKPYLVVSRELETDRTARYCYDVKPAFRGALMERLLAR